MKKIFLSVALAAVAATACTQELVETPVSEGKTYFSGSFIETRIALGDKTDSVYPLVWESGDEIAVFNASTGERIGTAVLDAASQGQNVGTFVLNQAIPSGTTVKVVYPAGEGYKIAAEQTKASAADQSLATRAESPEFVVTSDQAAFTLSHPNAVVKVDVSSADFKGMLLKSVSIYSAGAAIADESDYARLTFTEPAAVTDDKTAAAVFMTLPVTADADFYVAVKLVDPTDANKTVCIPKKFTAKQLKGGQVNRIDFSSLKLSDNALAWYNPVCNRYIPEGAWCYGESSTILLPPTQNASVTFDVRACGDFLDVIRYAREPKKMQLRCGDIVNTGTAGVWTVDGTKPKKKAFAPLNSLNPTIVLTMVPSNDKKAVAGLWNLCDAADKVIWSYLFWGATPGETAYEGGIMMNMNLGGSAADGKAAEQRGTYYQWGRPFPFGYGSDLQTPNTALRITSYQMSAENAMSLGCTGTPAENTDWWQDGTHKYDLWGNPETSETSTGGIKSIFDPCPKGWKVASAALLKEVYDNAVYDETNKWFTYKGDVWPLTSFYNGQTAARGGDNKGLFWADNAPNDNHGLHFEFVNDGTKTFTGTWRANASAVRCMKDADNR